MFREKAPVLFWPSRRYKFNRIRFQNTGQRLGASACKNKNKKKRPGYAENAPELGTPKPERINSAAGGPHDRSQMGMQQPATIFFLQKSYAYAGTFNMPTSYQQWLWEREAHINWSMVTCKSSTPSDLP